MVNEVKRIMEKDDTEYILIDSLHNNFEKLTFKEIKEKQVPAKTVINKLIECRDAIKKNEFLNKLNYKEIIYSVYPYVLTLASNIDKESNNFISNEMFVHDDLIGLNLNNWAIGIELEDEEQGYTFYDIDEVAWMKGIAKVFAPSESVEKVLCIPSYSETYIVSINDLKKELEKNEMYFEDEFSIRKILDGIERQDWIPIKLNKDIHIGNSVSVDDIIEYFFSNTKQKLDMAYRYKRPSICKKALELANQQEKKLMVIDILTNCEDDLDLYMEEAQKCGALAEPIYIMGYSLKEFICGNERQEKILKKIGHNYEYPEVGMTKEKREFILDLFKNQEISKNQQLDYIGHEHEKIKK